MKTNKPLQLNIPISKIDEEQRMVWGVATSEALDSQNDIVDYEASKAAFTEWPGNIREMHGSTAVGKGVEVEFDDVNKQVLVGAKISESADGENAWIKVKEGILTGFSIGGRMLEVQKDKAVEGADRITRYVLSELSLVDNPACPDAKFMMVKSADGGALQRVEQIKKNVYDAQAAIDVASQIAYLLMLESGETDDTAKEQIDLLTQAFTAIKDFVALEVKEDDDYVTQFNDVIEMGRKAINLRKDALMSKPEVEIEKATAVHAGEARDENAEVVAPEVKTDAPAKEAAGEAVADEAEKADVAEADKVEAPAETPAEDAPAEAVAPVEEVAPTTEAVAAPAAAEDDKSDKANSVADLAKTMDALLTKLNDNKEGAEFQKAFGDLKKSIDGVATEVSELKGRVTSLEDQPLPTKAKAAYSVITKGDSGEADTDTKRAALVARQDELIANPHDAKPGEHEQISRELRQLGAETKEDN